MNTPPRGPSKNKLVASPDAAGGPVRVEITGGGEIYAFQARIPIWAWPHLLMAAIIIIAILLGGIDWLVDDRLFTAILGPPPDITSR